MARRPHGAATARRAGNGRERAGRAPGRAPTPARRRSLRAGAARSPLRPYLPGGDLFLLRDLQQQPVVLQLQRPHTVNVNGQAVIELPQFLLLLQPGDAGRRQRGPARGAAARSA